MGVPSITGLRASFRTLLASTSAAAILVLASAAHAQIRDPGDHPKYSVDLEPHFVVEWDDSDTDYTNSDGFGLGLRASIPVVDNGPVTTINNTLAVGFGLDWAHFDGDCQNIVINGARLGVSCTGDHIVVPVVAQWNFFFTPVVSAFGEAGLAFQHASAQVSCDGVVGGICQATHSENDVLPVFAIGPRFTLSNWFAITVRVGYPYMTAGASFFL